MTKNKDPLKNSGSRTLDDTIEDWEREHEFRSLAENLPDNIVRYDREGRTVYVNPVLEETLGADAVRMLGTRVREYHADGSYESYAQALDSALASGENQEIDFVLPGTEKDPIVHQIRMIAVRDEHGEVSGALAIGRDITERKRAEAALAASEQQFRSLAENSPDNIVRYDRQCRARYYNPRMLQTIGVDPGKMLGMTPLELGAGGPEIDAEYERHIRQVLESGESRDMELSFQLPNGEFSHHLIRFVAERDTAGEIVGVLAIGRDVTALKQAERERQVHTGFLLCMDRINRAIQGASDLERMMSDVLDVVLSIYDCDRAFLMYPCDPEAAFWRVPMERNKPEYPGVSAQGSEMPMDADVSRTLRELLASDHPLKFGPETDHPLPDDVARQFGFRSFMSLAIHPKVGKAWQFGIHQCSYARVWTADEEKLLQEIGRRLADGLTSLLSYRDLRASEQLFRALVENSPDFIARYDREYRRIYINPAIQKLFGGKPEDVLGKTPADQSPVFAPQVYIDQLRQVIDTGTESAAEIPFRTAKGEMHWGHMRFVPEFDAGGVVVSVLAIGRDIHEIKENERHFRMLAENFPDFVSRFDRDGRYIYVNPAVEQAFGASAETIIGKTLIELPGVRTPEQNDALLALIRRVFAEGVVNESEEHWSLATGERIVELRQVPEKDAAGNVISALSIAHDITERKRSEEEIRKLNQELEQRVIERTAQLEEVNRELEAFSYSVSHDLRSPLRAIDGFSHILLEDHADRLAEEGKRLLGMLGDNAKRMTQLIEDMLQFSRTGRMELTFSRVDMEQLAHAVVEELRAGDSDSKLQIEIGPLPPAHGDSAMLRQVFVNLLSNAIKFSCKNETPKVMVGGAIQGDEIVYHVKDNGAGFNMQYADKLFGVFQRLHSINEFEGTGIGLAIVKRIITRHGGRVWAEGKVNEGATVYFALPLAPANADRGG